ncbi:ABC transporter permease [uncultured Tyzzerella sp.]|uniref:ABC transporter permease n=1 Tax=uncultured Tyzzerella sp. TaxID=2321398 RepID=UPI00294355B9|nr:ABC transporter permease [uncultured Tyzzerella sp.]
MDNNIRKQRDYKAFLSFLSSLFAILAGFIFAFIVLFVSNPKEAVNGFLTILQGGFTDGLTGFSRLIYFATPIIMTGLSVAFAFKTGLFNIGASGQFIIGAYVAVHIGVKWTFLPPSIHWVVALIGAGIAGALWGAIPGILKAFANVNEVISSIMTNYIGMYLVNMLVVKNVFDQLKNQSLEVEPSAIIPRLGIGDSNINYSIIIALVFVVIIYILLEKTTIGYELKACGQNKFASKYAGINEKKNIILAMLIAGLLSGIGGGLMYLYGSGKYIQVLDIIAPEGFSGISVALFGQSNPMGVFLAGLFIAHIRVGGINLQLNGYAPEIIDMIVASIIYFGAFALLFKNIISKLIKNFKKGDKK